MHICIYILGIPLKKPDYATLFSECRAFQRQLLSCYYINFSPSSNLLNLFRFCVCASVVVELKIGYWKSLSWWLYYGCGWCLLHIALSMTMLEWAKNQQTTHTKTKPWTHFDSIVRWNICYLPNDVKSGRLLSMKLTKVHSTDIQVTSIL